MKIKMRLLNEIVSDQMFSHMSYTLHDTLVFKLALVRLGK